MPVRFAEVSDMPAQDPAYKADSALQTCNEPKLVRQHYLGESAELIDAQLDHLAIVVYESDALPIIQSVTANHDLWCDVMLNAVWHGFRSLQSAPGGHVTI